MLRCSKLVVMLSICLSEGTSDGILVCELVFLSENAAVFSTAEIYMLKQECFCEIFYFSWRNKMKRIIIWFAYVVGRIHFEISVKVTNPEV